MISLTDERPPATADTDVFAPQAPGEADTVDAREVAAGRPWSRSHRLLTVGLLLTVAAWAFEALGVLTVLPATIDDLGGLQFYGWIVGAFFLTNLIGIAVSGGEVDRLGPVRPFVAGIALFVVGLLIGGLAPSIAVLITGRAIQGLGSGILGSVAYAIVGRGYPEAARPRMLALMSSAWVIPGLVGPAIAGLIAESVGWRWVYFGILPLPLLAVILATQSVRRISAGQTGPPAWDRARDSVLLALGMTALLAGFGQANVPVAVGLIMAGLVAAVPPLRRLLPPGTLRAAPGAAAAVAAMALLNLGFFGVDAFVPLALTDLRDQSVLFAGLAMTAATLAWSSGSWVLDRVAQRANRRILVQTGLVLVAVGIVLFGAALLPGTPVVIAPLAWGIAGLGMGLAYSTIQLVILETAPAGQEGVATSAMQLANTAAIALATGAGGALVAAFSAGDEASSTGLATQGILMLAAIGLGIAVAGRLPGRSFAQPRNA